DYIVGAVGALQFDVLAYRLKAEYGVDVTLDRLPYTLARWVSGDGFDPASLSRAETACVQDRSGRPVVLFASEWSLRWAEKACPRCTFTPTAEVSDAAPDA
ncbi:MAG TPA: peptide chain release factor 3, partial [Limnochordia bacterium]